MYIPRHYKQDRKKSLNYPLIIILILTIVAAIGIGLKWKEISNYFSGNSQQKISSLEEEISSNLAKGNFPKNQIIEYKSITNLYFESIPVDPTANFLVAKTYYYLTLDRIKFDNKDLLELTSFERKNSYMEYFQAKEDLEAMYRIALRASAFKPNFAESESNKVLIYLFELIVNRKKPQLLLGELSLIDASKLSKNLEKTFIWMNIVVSTLSGNLESLEKFILMNEALEIRKVDIQPRNISYLKGIAHFNNNDFIKSLNFLRESKSGYDLISIEATKFEAMIFFKQNLHDKAILLLETMYEDTGSQDKKIIKLLREIIESKPGLKTKIKLED